MEIYNNEDELKIESPRRKRKNSLTILDLLSYDTLLCVLSYLSPKDLITLSLVSKDTKMISEVDWIWRSFFPQLKLEYQNRIQVTNTDLLNLKFQNFKKTHGTAKRFYCEEKSFIERISGFLGLWCEKWCDVDVQNSTRISYDGNNIVVEYTKNKFEATFNSFKDNQLIFTLNGGDSGWSFVYTLTAKLSIKSSKAIIVDSVQPQSPDNNNNHNQSITTTTENLTLHVFRDHDKVEFNGIFCQQSCPSSPSVPNNNEYRLVIPTYLAITEGGAGVNNNSNDNLSNNSNSRIRVY